jgi:flavin-dependent dehydrogenase
VTTRDVDLAIVGGGPAGISTALHVRAEAPRLKVVVLEKAHYPREKICAGGIGARAFRILDRIDVAIDCPAVRLDAMALRIGDEVLTARQPRLGVVVRRVEFDHAFATAAIARGIEVRDGCGVDRIVAGDRIELHTDTGDLVRARAIVGADGVSGVVRTQAGFPRGELRAQVVELDTEATSRDLPRDTIVFDFTEQDLRGYAWDFPTIVDGRELVCRGAYVIRNLGADDARARVAAYLAERGLDLARYRLKRFAERGFEPGAAMAMPRVLLVGEAAGIDIATGEGIGQAIEYGALAGPYLAAAFARDDLGFTDWTHAVARHHLGRQLRIRHAAYRAFYGPGRATIERLLPRLGAFVEVGVQDFAGAPLSMGALARGGLAMFAGLVREAFRKRRAPPGRETTTGGAD